MPRSTLLQWLLLQDTVPTNWKQHTLDGWKNALVTITPTDNWEEFHAPTGADAIRVAGKTAHKACLGVYKRLPELVAGRPAYEIEGGGIFLYFSNLRGVWCIGDDTIGDYCVLTTLEQR